MFVQLKIFHQELMWYSLQRNTGAGKSTFLKGILGHTFKAIRDHFNIYVYNLDGDEHKDFESSNSSTEQKSSLQSYFCDEFDTYFADTPGYDDNLTFAASLVLKNLGSRAKRIRFAVLINVQDFCSYRTNELKAVLSHVQDLIGDNYRACKHCFCFSLRTAVAV